MEERDTLWPDGDDTGVEIDETEQMVEEIIRERGPWV